MIYKSYRSKIHNKYIILNLKSPINLKYIRKWINKTKWKIKYLIIIIIDLIKINTINSIILILSKLATSQP